MNKGTVLLIDDDPEFGMMLRELMEMEGYMFTYVQDAPCLDTLLRQHQPDLILLDFLP